LIFNFFFFYIKIGEIGFFIIRDDNGELGEPLGTPNPMYRNTIVGSCFKVYNIRVHLIFRKRKKRIARNMLVNRDCNFQAQKYIEDWLFSSTIVCYSNSAIKMLYDTTYDVSFLIYLIDIVHFETRLLNCPNK